MGLVRFPTLDHYLFASSVLDRPAAADLTTSFDVDARSIEFVDDRVGMLFNRLGENDSVVLPFVGEKGLDVWFVAASTYRQLDLTLNRVTRFLIPSYAEFAKDRTTPEFLQFEPNRNDFQKLGAKLFPAGYCRWQSPIAYRERVLASLGLWLLLESKRPRRSSYRRPNYGLCLASFEASLAAQDWIGARRTIQEIQGSFLTTGDNVAFLEIQLLARQQDWSAIWARPDFPELAKLRVPRAVREALLTAFHHAELLQYEQLLEWDQASAAFEQFLPRLGLLLTGRFGITAGPVLRVFGYLARRLPGCGPLDELIALASEDETSSVLVALHERFGAHQLASTESRLSPLQQARYALADGDFDAALGAVALLDEGANKTILLLQIAFASGDVQTASRALAAYDDLADGVRLELANSWAQSHTYLDYSRSLTGPTAQGPSGLQSVPSSINDWPEWLERLRLAPDDPVLPTAADRLRLVTEERLSDPGAVETLNEHLLAVATDERFARSPLVRELIRHLAATVLNASDFPRPDPAFDALYETLHLAILEGRGMDLDSCLTLNRLTEALVQANPARASAFWRQIETRYGRPIPALEAVVLAAMELLGDYGIDGRDMMGLYRQWGSSLARLPSHQDLTTVSTWIAIGEWIQPGDDVLDDLRARIQRAKSEEVDPIAALPTGYQIAIFVGDKQPSGAYRAERLLAQRNPGIKISVRAEKDLTPDARAAAQNADMSVLVWSAISHSFAYGLAPHISGHPIYPKGSNTASIIRAVEGALSSRTSHAA